jgi:2,4-didehydro-3-deoxy-L-rhamnonate hydrolase
MRIGNVQLANVAGRASIIVGGQVLDIESASGGAFSSDPMQMADLELHPRYADVVASAGTGDLTPLDPSRLWAPMPQPGKIVGVALNYRTHALESNLQIPEEPHVFAKFPNCVTGPFDPIVLPPGRDKVDYEAEIVVVIGRKCTAVQAEQAWDHIAGITAGQDVSDRGEQFRPPVKQFTMAKSYDSFGPIGPVMCTPDEFADRADIGLVGYVDGDEVQRGRSSDLIFSIPALVAWTSRYVTLLPGDLIFSGTPGGVGESRTPPLFLKPGMVVETEVEGVGRMRNPCTGD